MKRGDRLFVLALAALALTVPLGWWLFLREPQATAPVPVPPRAVVALDSGVAAPEVRLGAVAGRVELRRGDGGWAVADGGEVLSANDGVRTGDGSQAVLLDGVAWEVQLEPGTEVSVEELSASISRLMLENGMAHAQVHPAAKQRFEVLAGGSDAVAGTDGGSFTIATNGKGTVAVATEHGEVMLTAAGRVVLVRSGQRSLVVPGQAPSAPEAIPSSLLLKVAFPTRRAINTPKIVLVGTTEPGALVEVDGRVVPTDAQGRFSAPLQLTEGHNALQVKAHTVGGARGAASKDVELDTTVNGPIIDPRALWK